MILIKRFFIIIACILFCAVSSDASAVTIESVNPNENIFQYIRRTQGSFNQTLYQKIVGASNEFKEGDQALGLAASNETSRANARILLSNTKVKDIHNNPLFEDNLQELIWKTIDASQYNKVKEKTLQEIKKFLLARSESDIKGIMGGLNSDVIGCVVKLMSNRELIIIGQKVFNPLPGSKIGAKGYLGARIQPNSPTDNPEDIIWQVFNGWSYATGDLTLGTNPVSDSVENIAAIEKALKDVLTTFGIEQVMPWCVLAHIDKQAEVEKQYPGETALWFQSLAGCDQANQTFDLTIDKMMNYAKMRKTKFGLYFETGQGADFTNGAGNGFDMVIHESRKYGFARALAKEMEKASGNGKVWNHLNDVAGFIGPEIFKTREQLVRCCLEDIVLGKLHGLCLGLDICSTLHMPVTLDDLDWCMDQIMPANPAYLMGLPTKNDPMLSYLTTGFQDHVRLREKFGYKVSDAMWEFFKRIKIVDSNDKYTEHFGDPIWVYYQYLLAKGDQRSKEQIYTEGEASIKRIEARGVPIARGYGNKLWELNSELKERIRALYEDAKVSLKTEFTPEFIETVPNALLISTNSENRDDYIAHPPTGETLSPLAINALYKLRKSWAGEMPDIQIVISDGLNAKAIMDKDHLLPYLTAVKEAFASVGYTISEKNILLKLGRVRAGYKIGGILYGQKGTDKPKVILHIIGERPGSGHHNYSVYIAAPTAETWAKNAVDHDIARVVSGISDTAYQPEAAAKETLFIVKEMTAK
ncbi:MAG: ethanolamine ammonia-lyase subunit EutB [Deltaproteobacteria bacterium]|nr:ethanolamine ammonia-lyase subunit EutB [Deltaproteobacteria bacterium]